MPPSCFARSSESVQQMQPFVSGMRLSVWLRPPSLMRLASTLTSPMSFTITAAWMPWSFARMLLRMVVLPAPR